MNTSASTYNVLFLCTGNSARSILAEQLLNHWGQGRFRAFSAGSYPKGQVHPIALALLLHLKFPTEGLRSKSWDEFARPGAPNIDFIIKAFASLPLASLDRAGLKERLDSIGKARAEGKA